MAKKHCGGKPGKGAKTVTVQPQRRSKPGRTCHGAGKPGSKTVIKPHRRSRP